MREPLAVSLAAQLGVLPVLLATFGSFPLVTPIANVFAAPAAELVGVYGFLAAAIASVVPALGPLVQAPTALLVTWISTVARVGAACRSSSTPVPRWPSSRSEPAAPR